MDGNKKKKKGQAKGMIAQNSKKTTPRFELEANKETALNPNEPPELPVIEETKENSVNQMYLGPSSGIRSIKDMFKLLKREDQKRMEEKIEEENSSNDE